MSGYAKFMKELVPKKRNMDFKTIEVSHNCSAVMTSEMIIKKQDPEAFTIPCTIGMLQLIKALYDFGASINLMPYAIFKQLGMGEPKSTTMRLLMTDRSIRHPVGILYDILVKVDRFIFLADFVILDFEIDTDVPIIFGRQFLATGRALMDVESGELKFRVNEDEVTFNVCKSMKHPSDIYVVSTIDIIDAAMARLGEYSRNPLKLDIDLRNRENPPAKPSTEEPSKLELKVLPAHLRYAFWGANNTLPVIIPIDLLEWDLKLLLEVLRSYQSSIGMTPYEASYRRKCWTPLCWSEVGERKLVGPEIVQQTEDKEKIIKDRLKISSNRQKSYADLRRRDIEYQVGDKVFLKVSP
ncbi:uncharacterized protein [Solanum tuberosum]|uniref:uncharacterized protein n=1 Tax=Solanum tuberosum TaxID=4113 RepID=UPI00073A1779|nr:PREDICTED: uncharacterized protein LOC102586401 [Solanum tuberosum]